jgi:glutamate synthase domain-containing protein 2/NAD-dependent dihydropyrimidine dehydrogenase PreA subunit
LENYSKEISNERMKPSTAEIQETPSRFRHRVPKYKVIRSDDCINCGTCVKTCLYGVHEKADGHNKVSLPVDYKCIGFECQGNDFYCVTKCPRQALSLSLNPMYATLGDFRWTADMITGTWIMAETGYQPQRTDLEYNVGNSGGGFDKLWFKQPVPDDYINISDDDIDTSIALNKRDNEQPKLEISLPCYSGGMSFGSTALSVLIGRARAAKRLNTLTCTGEGGYPPTLIPYADNVITQVATGLFGVREETILFAPVVEFKYAQGAKPGLGGHLLGDKVTPEVAAIRETVVGNALFSPFPFHSVYSVEDHKKHVDWIRQINPRALISVKVSTPTDADMVAVGSYYAGANIIHFDGGYGGTGAAPEIAKKNIAMPIEYAIPKVHRFLKEEGVRNEVCLIASGGIRSAMDVAKAIALGADGAVIGTAELVALECVRCGNCESGRGCARGIATTDSELGLVISEEWAEKRIVNMYSAWRKQWCELLRCYGLQSIRELVGRTDLLEHLDYTEKSEKTCIESPV